MAITYSHCTDDYQWDVIAEQLYNREHEHYHYELDRQNFVKMLETLEPGPFREEVQERLTSTIREQNKVEAIYNSLLAQIDDKAAFDAAMARVIAKRAAA
jgi:hypothetical protein